MQLHSKYRSPAISKPSTKAIKLGKRSKGNRLDDYRLLVVLSNPKFNLTLLEDLDEVDMLVNDPRLPFGSYMISVSVFCFCFVFCFS